MPVAPWASAFAEQLVTVRQAARLRVFRVAVGELEVLSYPERERAEQVAEALRRIIAEASTAAAEATIAAARFGAFGPPGPDAGRES